MGEKRDQAPVYVLSASGEIPRWLDACMTAAGRFSVVERPEDLPSGNHVVCVYAPDGSLPRLPLDDTGVRLLLAPSGAPSGGFDAVMGLESEDVSAHAAGIISLARILAESKAGYRQALERVHSLAEANREAARLVEQIEERDRRIREQQAELEERAKSLARANAEAGRVMLELEERDRRIREQSKEIRQYLDTLRREMGLARTLQIGLLPDDKPPFDDLVLAERFIPATELCGDYYDYILLPDGSFIAVVADVTGHGVASAMVSVQVRALAHIHALQGLAPGRILERLNRFMFDTFRRHFLMTMVMLKMEPDYRVTFAGAGHNPFLLAGPVDDHEYVFSQGIPLGVLQQYEYKEDEIAFEPGARILLYTDGLVEVTDADDGQYGMDRLAGAFNRGRDQEPVAFVDDLLREVQYFAERTLPFGDDVTVVLMERRT